MGGTLSRSIAQEQKRHILGDHRGARIRYARFFFSLREEINSLKISTNDADERQGAKKVVERPRPAGETWFTQ